MRLPIPSSIAWSSEALGASASLAVIFYGDEAFPLAERIRAVGLTALDRHLEPIR